MPTTPLMGAEHLRRSNNVRRHKTLVRLSCHRVPVHSSTLHTLTHKFFSLLHNLVPTSSVTMMFTEKFRSLSFFTHIFSCIKTRVVRKHPGHNDLEPVDPHRICSTHDVVDHILSFLNKPALVQCAQVNKQWNSIATPFLWQSGANNGVQTILRFVDTHYVSQELDPVRTLYSDYTRRA